MIFCCLQLLLAAVAYGREFKANFGPSPAPFTIDVEPCFVEETRIKASLTRLPLDLVEHQPADGPPPANISTIRDAWSTSYNWTRVQDDINRHLKQYTTTVDGAGNYSHPIPLHFVHHVSPRADAIPLLFLHGYPGSFLEVDRIIDSLVEPSAANATAFHVVAPSFPGSGFSPAPEFPGLGLREAGFAFDKLMKLLGYAKYVVHGGDLGSHTLRYMALDNPASVRAIHTNLWFVAPTVADMDRFNAGQATDKEAALISVLAGFRLTLQGQRQVFVNQPLQWAYSATDSPVGHAAWVQHELVAGSPSYPWPLHEIITWSMMLYIQGPFGSARLYKELVARGQNPWTGLYCAGDVGQKAGEYRLFNEYPFGGHFASWEVPEHIMTDVRAFMRPGSPAWDAFHA